MSQLLQRINSVGQIDQNTRIIAKDYMDVKAIPLTRVQITTGMIGYETVYPIITADGAPIMATGVGSWGQLYAAGRR